MPLPVGIVASPRPCSSTIDTAATARRTEAPKRNPVPSLPNKIAELERINSDLRHEITYYRRMEQARKEFYYEVRRTSESLGKSICRLGTVQKQVDHDWVQRGAEIDQSGSEAR
jgi:hypothetical protein